MFGGLSPSQPVYVLSSTAWQSFSFEMAKKILNEWKFLISELRRSAILLILSHLCIYMKIFIVRSSLFSSINWVTLYTNAFKIQPSLRINCLIRKTTYNLLHIYTQVGREEEKKSISMRIFWKLFFHGLFPRTWVKNKRAKEMWKIRKQEKAAKWSSKKDCQVLGVIEEFFMIFVCFCDGSFNGIVPEHCRFRCFSCSVFHFGARIFFFFVLNRCFFSRMTFFLLRKW